MPGRDVFTLSYVGSLHFPQKLDPFLEGFERFIAAENIHNDSCVLNFIGTPDLPLIRRKYQSLIPFVNTTPYMQKQAAIEVMLQSHILLLFLNNDNGWYPAKIYDYLASDRIILSSPDNSGVINRILNKSDSGVVLDKPLEISEWISNRFREFREGKTLRGNKNSCVIKEFDRRRLTERLSRILKTIPLTEPGEILEPVRPDTKI